MDITELRKPSTSIDWSEHKLTIIKNEHVLIHKLKKPGTCIDMVIFINSMGVCSVTGDYGNWIFCRELHPSKNGYVSRSYWSEKLKISSTQHSAEFDRDTAIEQINKLLNDEEQQFTQEERDWLDDLKSAADEGEYAYHAEAIQYPDHFDIEMIPKGLKRMYWLDAVYDAFNEICSRID